jgi:hypothetical protein
MTLSRNKLEVVPGDEKVFEEHGERGPCSPLAG